MRNSKQKKNMNNIWPKFFRHSKEYVILYTIHVTCHNKGISIGEDCYLIVSQQI